MSYYRNFDRDWRGINRQVSHHIGKMSPVIPRFTNFGVNCLKGMIKKIKKKKRNDKERDDEWRNRLMDIGRGEERVRCMERATWKLTLPCVK